MSYIAKFILIKQIYIYIYKFWPNASKKFNKYLINNQIPKYLSKHMKNVFQVLSFKFEIQNKLANGN